MIGAIAGDIIGSPFEFRGIPRKNFKLFSNNCRFTDDTVLTVALADTILNSKDWVSTIRLYYRRYPNCGYGGYFRKWAELSSKKYIGGIPYNNSFGNGSAMRTSPVGWVYKKLHTVSKHAEGYAKVTHNHPEAIKGAQAISSAIYLARKYKSKSLIKRLTQKCYYRLNFTIESIKQYSHLFSKASLCSCQTTVPIAIKAFLESKSFEDAIRLSVSFGGDTDTMACMAGSIAEAFYGVPEEIEKKTLEILDPSLRAVVKQFQQKYCCGL